MTIRKLITLSLFISGLLIMLRITSCQTPKEKDQSSTLNVNDTTAILEIGLNFALIDSQLIDIPFLTHITQYSDSLESAIPVDSIWVMLYALEPRHLPEIEPYRFKITTREAACQWAGISPAPNILELELYDKSDTAAWLRVVNTCVHSNGEECFFGFLCGGGLGVKTTKIDGVWEGKIESRWAD